MIETNFLSYIVLRMILFVWFKYSTQLFAILWLAIKLKG